MAELDSRNPRDNQKAEDQEGRTSTEIAGRAGRPGKEGRRVGNGQVQQ